MFWDRSQIAIVSAFDKEYILYCVNPAFGHDPKNHLSKFLRFCLGTIPNDHLGPIPRIIQSCFRARSQNFPRELFKLVLGMIPIFVLYPSCEVFKLVLGRIPTQLLRSVPLTLQTNFCAQSQTFSWISTKYPYFCFRTITWVNINGFSSNSV